MKKKYRCVNRGKRSIIQQRVDKTLFGCAWEMVFDFTGCKEHAERITDLLNKADEITQQNVSKS